MNGEYKFEQAIKQDEKRIACYYDNLPLFLDLPGENEAIFERIAKTSGEKVRSCSDSGELRQAPSVWSSDYDEGIDEEQAEKYFNNEYIDYHIEFFYNGLNAVIKKWLENGCKDTPEEIEKIIKSEYSGRKV